MRWRQQYADPHHDEALGQMTAVSTSDDLTVQAYKDETDINVMMRRFKVTGQLPVNAQEARYGDFSSPVDFQEALNRVIAARSEFDRLPADLRDRFGNDPARLLAFLSDERNADEAVKLGLRAAPELPPIDPAQVVKDSSGSIDAG